jgi:hypothetical protein
MLDPSGIRPASSTGLDPTRAILFIYMTEGPVSLHSLRLFHKSIYSHQDPHQHQNSSLF